MTMMRLGLLLLFVSFAAHAQQFGDPSGLYYFRGSAQATKQWFQVQSNDGGAIFAITDFQGRGFTTDFNDGKALQVGQNQINLQAQPGQSAAELFRVVNTDSSFPLAESRFVPPHPIFEGAWDIEEFSLDPITGEVLPQFDGSLIFIDVFDLSIDGDGLRFTDSLRTYFQGPMSSGTAGSFRRVRQLSGAIDPDAYRNTPGSRANFSRDIVGQMRFDDVNHYDVLLALSSYDSVDPQHFLLSIQGTRRTPLAAGDLNADGSVDGTDRGLLQAQVGLANTSVGFNLAADLDGNRHVDLRDLAVFDQAAVSSQPVVAGISGLWFNPARSGEGWDIQILSDGTAYVAWFTYKPSGEPLWLVGSGQIVGNEIIVPEFLIATQGTRFGPDFDPNEVVLEVWGGGRLYFSTCADGGMSYAGPVEYGNGGVSMTRLSAMAGVNCAGNGAPANDASKFSGIWFDPSKPFQGWLIHGLADNQAVMTWYTYDENRNPLWLIGNGSVVDNVLTVTDLLTVSGAQFGSAFDPDDAIRLLWGDLQFTRSDCNGGELNYTSMREGFGTGTLQAARLGAILNLPCTE